MGTWGWGPLQSSQAISYFPEDFIASPPDPRKSPFLEILECLIGMGFLIGTSSEHWQSSNSMLDPTYFHSISLALPQLSQPKILETLVFWFLYLS